MEKIKKLFSPFSLGSLRLRNRIVMAPMGTNFGREDGMITERAMNYYVERAKGGVGLIITESSPVNQQGRHRVRCMGAFDDKFIPGLRRFVDAVHENGAAIALQLIHAGRNTSEEITGSKPLAPSPIPRFEGAPVPKEMSLDEINQTVIDFGLMAYRAKEAGFDAVEIHGGHGYLINQFFSQRVNRREDVYGGSTEKRGRFAIDVLKQVRKIVGDAFPVIFRLSAREMVEGGYEIEEGLLWAKEIEKAGANLLNVSGGSAESFYTVVQFVSPMSFPEGYLVPLAEAVKQVVTIPVAIADRLNNPSLAEQVLNQGKADFIAVGRNFLTDPYWPKKAEKGDLDRIRPCVACNVCLWSLQQANGDVICFQNAALGSEEESRIQPARESKKVLVIGGGPAGMEAARVARIRGHRVTLIEKNSYLGGQFSLASIPPHKQTLKKAVEWQIRELEYEGVEVKFNTEATLEILQKEKPDGLIIATGALPLSPDSFSGPHILTAWEVLSGKETERKVLILGGGMVGAETAEFLHEKGCQVTIVEMLKELAAEMEGTTRLLLLKRISDANISVMLSSTVKEVQETRVLISSHGEEKWLDTETVVLAMGSRPNQTLLTAIKKKFPEIIPIGDCLEPRKAKEAIHEGFKAGLQICS